jgi:hypothetical protein
MTIWITQISETEFVTMLELPMYETENSLRYKMPETKLNGRGVLLSHFNSSFSVYLQK